MGNISNIGLMVKSRGLIKKLLKGGASEREEVTSAEIRGPHMKLK